MWAVQDLDAYDDAADDQDDEGVIDAADSWTVTDLMGQIRAYIGDMFPDEIWVTGEVANLNRSARGHVYFSLIDPDGDPKKPIALKVTLFDWYRKPVNHILTRAHGQIRMDNGVQIRVRGSVELYAARGEISLRMTSIDPNFTLGLIEAERNALLRRLAESGQLRANGLLPRPQLPLRIALITSRGSAAEADFCEELARYGYGFRVTLIDARVQGAESVDSIVSAFDTAQALDVDVVALVRGGGAKTDLASFDAEPVALAIALTQLEEEPADVRSFDRCEHTLDPNHDAPPRRRRQRTTRHDVSPTRSIHRTPRPPLRSGCRPATDRRLHSKTAKGLDTPRQPRARPRPRGGQRPTSRPSLARRTRLHDRAAP